MEASPIYISGGYPIFQGPITINVYNDGRNSTSPARHDKQRENAPRGSGWEECDYSKPVTPAEMKDFLDHAAKQQEFYQISNYPKGRVLIVNNEFRGEYGKRKGSDQDLYDMCQLWKSLGCSIAVETDLTAHNLLLRVKEFAAQQERSDFCVVIIMSHGREDDMIVGSKKGKLAVKSVVEIIEYSPSLKTKPKLIFFQMCRGSYIQKTQVDSGVFNTDGSTWINEMLHEVLPNGKILGSEQTEVDANAEQYVSLPKDAMPTSAPEPDGVPYRQPQQVEIDATAEEHISGMQDVMLAFATQPDCVSFRDPTKGSWFIQSINRVFAGNAAKHDVRALMSMVKEDLKKNIAYAPGTDLHEGMVTMDGSDSFGKKRLMLFPGFPKPNEE